MPKMLELHARIEESNYDFLVERAAYYGLESKNAALNIIIREARVAWEKENHGDSHHGKSRSAASNQRA